MNVALGLQNFPDEAALIGRILGSYTSLEVDLMNTVKAAQQELDTVLKAMYRPRGESTRLNVADAFGRQYYRSLGLGQEFEAAIGAMRHCIKIRNQYAHCIWWDDRSGRLAFANLEELAQLNNPVRDIRGLTTHHVDVPLLTEQFGFFEHVSDLLVQMPQIANKKVGKPHVPNLQKPAARLPPPLHL